LGCSQGIYAAAPPHVVGQIVWVKGVVEASNPAHPAKRVLQRRSAVYEKDTIVTSASGSAQIVFTDKSVVALRPATTFRIDQYQFNHGASHNAYQSSLIKGGFRTITGFISKSNPDHYHVRTPVATIGIRGTEFTIAYSHSKGLAASLVKGAIVIANEVGQVELNAAKDRVYAEISGLRKMPEVKHTPSSMLKGQPAITTVPANLPSPIPIGASSTVAPSSSPPTSTVSSSEGDTHITSTDTGSTTTTESSVSVEAPSSSSSPRSVTDFCIN